MTINFDTWFRRLHFFSSSWRQQNLQLPYDCRQFEKILSSFGPVSISILHYSTFIPELTRAQYIGQGTVAGVLSRASDVLLRLTGKPLNEIPFIIKQFSNGRHRKLRLIKNKKGYRDYTAIIYISEICNE